MSSPTERRRSIRERLSREVFDLVVVGGGITGAAIARDAAMRHYSVALLEQNDFAFGTSSRSSRLVHGGLRYLEHGQVRLVFESVSERARLARNARHIVRPLPFVFPVYSGQLGLLTMDIGLWIYDALALFRNYQSHEELSPLAISELLPGMRREGLQGAVLYYDYQTDDARLVLENVLSSIGLGAAPLSYCRVENLQPDVEGIRTVEARDLVSGETLSVRGRTVVVAAGPWTDAVLGTGPKERWLRPTKGVHIVMPREVLPVSAALVMRHPEDSRILFALPYHERVVLGTTDTDFEGDPGQVTTTADDVRYLLDAARYYFPEAPLDPDRIISTWAGVRPLLDPGDVSDPSAVSREHRIETTPDGLCVIAGGKLTTYRRMAAECVDEVAPVLAARGGPEPQRRPPTHRAPLPGGVGLASDAELEGMAVRLGRAAGSPAVGKHLAETYGARAEALLALAASDAALARPVVQGLPYLWAEVCFAAREDLALTLADALLRRTQVFYRAEDQGLAAAPEAAERMRRELGWDDALREKQLSAYRQLVDESRAWRRAFRG